MNLGKHVGATRLAGVVATRPENKEVENVGQGDHPSHLVKIQTHHLGKEWMIQLYIRVFGIKIFCLRGEPCCRHPRRPACAPLPSQSSPSRQIRTRPASSDINCCSIVKCCGPACTCAPPRTTRSCAGWPPSS